MIDNKEICKSKLRKMADDVVALEDLPTREKIQRIVSIASDLRILLVQNELNKALKDQSDLGNVVKRLPNYS